MAGQGMQSWRLACVSMVVAPWSELRARGQLDISNSVEPSRLLVVALTSPTTTTNMRRRIRCFDAEQKSAGLLQVADFQSKINYLGAAAKGVLISPACLRGNTELQREYESRFATNS